MIKSNDHILISIFKWPLKFSVKHTVQLYLIFFYFCWLFIFWLEKVLCSELCAVFIIFPLWTSKWLQNAKCFFTNSYFVNHHCANGLRQTRYSPTSSLSESILVVKNWFDQLHPIAIRHPSFTTTLTGTWLHLPRLYSPRITPICQLIPSFLSGSNKLGNVFHINARIYRAFHAR